MFKKKEKPTLNTKKICSYTNYLVMPLKMVACWEWYPNPKNEFEIIINNIYLALVLFVLIYLPVTLAVNLYTEWVDIMECLDKIADGLPPFVSVAIVAYFAFNKQNLYELVRYMDDNFKYCSAKGLTNMTMVKSYTTAKNFAYVYTACTLFSVSMYVILPVVVHLLTKLPLQPWIYMDVTNTPLFVITFLRQGLTQAFVGLAMGQLGVFFATNSIILCGQLDLLCCSLRNVRYTALLQNGVKHASLRQKHGDIVNDERHNYIYNQAEMEESKYHYDREMINNFASKTQFDIYSPEFDAATADALCECAFICQIIQKYKEMFESFVSPLLALRVIQVTLYLCTLLYAATLKFDIVIVEYMVAVALDIYVYCYFGNQIILQADRVSTAAYQSGWHAMGVKPRRMLLNILVANKRPIVIRAGGFLYMDLHTFVVIIQTSFSYYTLLVNVNETH